MTSAASVDDAQVAFVLPALGSDPLTATPPHALSVSPRRVTCVRRPRTAFRSAWTDSGEFVCTCRRGGSERRGRHRSVTRCTSGGDGNSEDLADRRERQEVSKQGVWLEGLNTLFGKKHAAGGDRDGEEHAEGASGGREGTVGQKRGLKRDAETDVRHSKAERRKEEGRPGEKFRWFWQKEGSVDGTVQTNGDTERHCDEQAGAAMGAKRVSHTDSKPGGSFAKGGPSKVTGKPGKEESPQSLQKRWDNMIGMLPLNLGRKDSSRGGVEGDTRAGSHGPSERNVPERESQLRDPEKISRSESVSELYSPPSDTSDPSRILPASRRKSRGAKWPRLPWQRDDEENASQRKPSSGNMKSVNAADDGAESVSRRENATVEDGVFDESKRDTKKKKVQITIADGRDSKEAELVDADSKSDVKESNAEKSEPALPLRTARTSQPKTNPFDMGSIPQRDIAAIRLIFGSETFFATETLSPPGGLIFRGNLRGEPNATLAKLEERLAARLGDKYTLCLAQGEEDLRPVVVVVPSARDKRPASPRQRVFAFSIAIVTVSTCLARGLYAALYKPMIQPFYPATGSSLASKLFSVQPAIALTTSTAIGLVLLMSQLVQRLVASWHGTRVALPYLIPSFQLGSFGVVVQLASPTPTRAALFDIALAGAATLVVISMACLLVGLRLSTGFPSVVPVPMATVSNSVVIGFLTQQVPQGQILVDYGRSLIGLHPLAVIGANCLTIAALNLLPIRQLDGGRIISALYGRRTAVWASRVTVLFLLLASSKTPYFVMFLAAVTFGPWNLDRPAKNELTEPNGFRTIVGYIFMLLMIGVLLPYPASRFFGTLSR